MIEDIINGIDDGIQRLEGNLPLWTKLVYGRNINNIKKSISRFNEDLDYLAMGDEINNLFSEVSNAVDRTYNLYESVERVSNVFGEGNFIGDYLSGKTREIELSLKESIGFKRIPTRGEGQTMINKLYDATMYSYSVVAGMQTGNSAEVIYDQIYNPLKKYQKTFFDIAIEKVSDVICYVAEFFN